jgi:hypothetical protein
MCATNSLSICINFMLSWVYCIFFCYSPPLTTMTKLYYVYSPSRKKVLWTILQKHAPRLFTHIEPPSNQNTIENHCKLQLCAYPRNNVFLMINVNINNNITCPLYNINWGTCRSSELCSLLKKGRQDHTQPLSKIPKCFS